MENEIKVGDWIRTKAGQIHKVTRIVPYYENDKLVYDRQGIYWDNKHSGYEIWQLEDIIVKHSSNLIDLIQCGDYVNGYKVEKTDNGFIYCCESNGYYEEIIWKNEGIKTVVTKEQFESISYKVKE